MSIIKFSWGTNPKKVVAHDDLWMGDYNITYIFTRFSEPLTSAIYS